MTNPLLLSPLLVLCMPQIVYAGTVEDAEHVRLTEEMRRLSKRNAWKGVDAAFIELMKLSEGGQVTLTFDDYFMGAQAARGLGDINKVYTRLKAAAQVQGTEEVITWLSEIDAVYGSVVLKNERKQTAALSAVMMPFAPDQRSAIEAAMDSIATHGEYLGLLPKGDYNFGGQVVTVSAGGEPIEVILIQDRTQKDTSAGLSRIGPRISIGPSMTNLGGMTVSGTGQDGDWSYESSGFLGAGARAGIGIEAGFGERLGAFVELGYQGGFGPAITENVESKKVNFGYGWLGGVLRFGDFWLALGPTWSVGMAYVADELDSCGTDEGCVIGTSGSRIMAPGGSLGISYALMEIGNFDGALSLIGGGQSDGSRMYTWGQLAFTLAPASSRSD